MEKPGWATRKASVFLPWHTLSKAFKIYSLIQCCDYAVGKFVLNIQLVSSRDSERERIWFCVISIVVKQDSETFCPGPKSDSQPWVMWSQTRHCCSQKCQNLGLHKVTSCVFSALLLFAIVCWQASMCKKSCAGPFVALERDTRNRIILNWPVIPICTDQILRVWKALGSKQREVSVAPSPL